VVDLGRSFYQQVTPLSSLGHTPEMTIPLLLAEPICVDAKPEYDYDAETDQSEVTLIPHHGEKLSAYTEKQVIVSGTLFHAYTGHHNTPVLIELNSIHVGRD
jgi:hypothetical protein